MINEFQNIEKKKIIRIIFLCAIAFEIYLYYSNTLIHQLQNPSFFFLDYDLTYWFLFFLKIPQTIINNRFLSYSLDVSIISLSIICFLYPLKKYFIILFIISLFLYLIIRNSYGLFHEHLYYGFLFILIPFTFKNNLIAKYLWEFVRYIQFFIYFSAFLWKACRFHFFDYNHMMSIFQFNISSYIFQNPNTIFSSIYTTLLPHSNLIYVCGLLGLLFEAIYVIGFFTKKYDLFFFYLGIFNHLFFWFFADAFLFPVLILNLTLLRFNNKPSFLAKK